jgi:hypothetical protein
MLLIAHMVWAQEKIEAPVWNVGDKWAFTQGMNMKVIRADENSYVVEVPNQVIILEKSTLNKIFILRGKKREVYRDSQRRLFDFPLVTGKNWKDNYSAQLRTEDVWVHTGKAAVPSLGDETIIYENYKVLGWEEVEVEAGRFNAIKMEYKREWNTSPGGLREGKAWYWYSPEVKNMVKVQYEKNQMWSKENDWELISFLLTR